MQRMILAVVVAFGLIAFAYAETNCESHRRNSRNSAHGMNWVIECDSDGYYIPLQCTNDTETKKWCACYNKEEAITSPSRKTRTCDCPLKSDEASRNNASECDVPQCAKTGKWEAKQCCQTSGTCRCVNPNTGENTSEPTRNTNLQC